ncbi:MAG: permease of phosphate ABC transporter [Oscillospiraceae bacterium]
MKKLYALIDRCMDHCSWKDLGLIKVCMLALGILLGIALPKKAKRPMFWVAVVAFLATYVPLLVKFLPLLPAQKDAI